MKIRNILALLVLASMALHSSQAAPKKSAKADDRPPSEQLERLLEPSLDAILAPLEQNPKMPRVEVEKLRSNFAGGQIRAKTPAQQQIYQNAMTVCSALTAAMDDRAKARSDAQVSAKNPSIMNGSGIIKSSPMRGWDAGRNAEAIRKKQGDERRYADKMGKEQSGFIESGAYKVWTEKSAFLRQSVMALYTRQIQLEAFDERNTAAREAAAPPPPKKPAPADEKPTPAVAAKPTEKGDAAKERPYLGKWKGSSGKTYLVNEDHTLVRLAEGSEGEVKGTWELTPKGVFVIAIDIKNSTHYKLSDDGKAMKCTTSTTRWDRLNPTEAGASATTGVTAVPSANKPAKETSYVGSWTPPNAAWTIFIEDNHTGYRTTEKGAKVNGTWNVEEDGDFQIKWDDHTSFKGKLSGDGQSIQGSIVKFSEDDQVIASTLQAHARWTRKSPPSASANDKAAPADKKTIVNGDFTEVDADGCPNGWFYHVAAWVDPRGGNRALPAGASLKLMKKDGESYVRGAFEKAGCHLAQIVEIPHGTKLVVFKAMVRGEPAEKSKVKGRSVLEAGGRFFDKDRKFIPTHESLLGVEKLSPKKWQPFEITAKVPDSAQIFCAELGASAKSDGILEFQRVTVEFR